MSDEMEKWVQELSKEMIPVVMECLDATYEDVDPTASLLSLNEVKVILAGAVPVIVEGVVDNFVAHFTMIPNK